jgi:Ser/Thr protein kinase RdoA (MazF antagonist)
MDDHKAYMLNGLLERHFDLGRIVRFRQVHRGRQAECFELLTAGNHELLLELFPSTFDKNSLDAAVALMDQVSLAGFPAPRANISRASQNNFVVTGPQGTHMVLSSAPQGQPISKLAWTHQDLCQLGLRLAWMHRLMAETSPPAAPMPLGDHLRRAVLEPAPRGKRYLHALNAGHLEKLAQMLEQNVPSPSRWRHGGLSPESLLLDSERQISAILDWGQASAGLPEEDLVDVFVLWCVDDDGQVRTPQAQSLFQSYLSLNSGDTSIWHQAVLNWCAHHVLAALSGRSALPRGFATILENPQFLSAAISLCLSKI